MDWVFVHEGGYAERDSEPGGAVNMGVSFLTFQDWWKKQKRDGSPTFADLRAMTREEAEEIFFHLFFKPVEFDVLPPGVDYAFVDFAVNSGVGGAIRAIKRHVKWPNQSSKMDAKFLWLFKGRPQDEVIDLICDARLRLSQSSKNWERFKGNWTRRIDTVRARAKKMVDE